GQCRMLAPSFFFAGRQRHTISKRDWSSDVCSSDLTSLITCHEEWPDSRSHPIIDKPGRTCRWKERRVRLHARKTKCSGLSSRGEIGRASCREGRQTSGAA